MRAPPSHAQGNTHSLRVLAGLAAAGAPCSWQFRDCCHLCLLLNVFLDRGSKTSRIPQVALGGDESNPSFDRIAIFTKATSVMPWDDWRKDFNKKLDDFGEDAKQKYRQQREANAGGGSGGSRVGLHDRMNMLKGENPRWNRDVESRSSAAAGAAEHASTVVPERSRVPPAPPSALNKGRPPPPPSRHSGSSATGTAPPALPARMQNEDGTSHPPPPYPPTAHTQHAYPTSQGSVAHIEFSRFTREDKEAFFSLLDEVSSNATLL